MHSVTKVGELRGCINPNAILEKYARHDLVGKGLASLYPRVVHKAIYPRSYHRVKGYRAMSPNGGRGGEQNENITSRFRRR